MSALDGGAGIDAASTQLRTVVLCDLVESTRLIERLGNTRGSALLHHHDRMVRRLLIDHAGRSIDKSDGFLALFERPVSAVGFALAYQRELRVLASTEREPLQARIGIHVGEVLTWDNAPEDIAQGAKPTEVEGLAKPIAARLMNLARPGQILLSGMAYTLARRASDELQLAPADLRWLAHGRYRFRGLPMPLPVHEVGEIGIAPLRAPRSGAKARRDIPWWRRPAVLALEAAAALAIIAVTTLVGTPSAPALAFAERDWVVVGDLQNLTGDSRFDGALQTALRISLEQSRHVNLVSELRVDDTLRHMGRTPDTSIDRKIGGELAVREGARALLLPTLAEVGGRLRFSVEVIDPASLRTVFSKSAQSDGAGEVVGAVGDAADELRTGLGEALASVDTSSAPLERVSSSNLDALRAFSLGQEAYARQRLNEAEQYYSQAVAIEPGFAMAHSGLARVAFGRTDVVTALAEMNIALADPSRLTDRERLYARAQMAYVQWTPDVIEQWRTLVGLYPDFHAAAFNVAQWMRYANDYAEMEAYARRAAVSVAVTRPAAIHYRGIAELGQGKLDQARASFAEARELGFRGGAVEEAMVWAAGRDFDAAHKLLKGAMVEHLPADMERKIAEITFFADEGNWKQAEALAMTLVASVSDPHTPFEWFARGTILAVAAKRDAPAARLTAARHLLQQAEAALPAAVGRLQEPIVNAALVAGYVAAGDGDQAMVRRALRLAAPVIAHAPRPVLANFAAIVEARLALHRNRPQEAKRLLADFVDGTELLLTQVTAVQIATALGDTQRAETLAADVASQRGRAYAEWAAERPPVLEALLAQ